MQEKQKARVAKLKARVKKIPNSPGVYFWYQGDSVIYVGRSVNLKNRLSQYFQKNIAKKTKEMLSLATKIEYQKTETLLEAIILEASLIKKYWPKYNVSNRDDRSFLYLAFNLKEDFPKPKFIRAHNLEKYTKENYEIFGPYQSYRLLKTALNLLRKIFPYSTCQANSQKACFDYQIGLCPGTCLGKISKREYRKNIKAILDILAGKRSLVLKNLEKTNPEKALALRHLQEVSLLNKENDLEIDTELRIEAYDVSHFQGKEVYASMVVWSQGRLRNSEYRLFKIKKVTNNDSSALLETLERRLKHKDWPLPDYFLLDGGKPQVSFLEKNLKNVKKGLKLFGISELGGDILVFSKEINKEDKELLKKLKTELLKLRDEAHRFANLARKRACSFK